MRGSDPISEVYQAMAKIGYESGEDFLGWESRVQIFHVTKTGGIAFLNDPGDVNLWWLNAYCPNARPSDNTVKFLIGLCFAAGCKVIRSNVKRSGSARFLTQLGFQKAGDKLYELRSA